MRLIHWRQHLHPAKRLIPGFISSFLFALLYWGSALQPLEHLAYRLLFLLRGEQTWDSRLVLITIDDPSLQVLGRFPWPRQRYTELLQTLLEGKPNTVAFNLIWSEPGADDPDLGEMLRNHGAVILATAWDAQGNPIPPVPSLQEAAQDIGHVMKSVDEDGIVRKVDPWLGTAPTLPVLGLATAAAYRQVSPSAILPPGTNPVGINWPGSADTLTQYSFVDVWAGNIPAAAFENKIVLVGATAVGLDPLLMPYRQSPANSGVYLHAAVIQNLLQQNFLKPWGWQALPLLIACAPFLHGWLLQQSVRSQLRTVTLLTIGWFFLGLGCFKLGIWIPLVMPIALIMGTSFLNLAAERLRENHLLRVEIAERQRIETELRYNLSHDDLTGLLNRRGFLDQLQESIARVQADPEFRFVVYFLDLDRFKLINDTFGHFAGDQLLKQVSDRLRTCIPGDGYLARFGGDEFAILLENMSDREIILATAQEIRKNLQIPSFIKQQIIFIDTSIGIVIVDSNYHHNAELTLRDADIAMYAAKTQHTGYEIFQPSMQEIAQNSLTLEMELHKAIAEQAFEIYYQPIVNLETGAIVGFESLLRWFHPQYGFISPLKFIPIAEETNLIIELGEWAFLEACRTLKSWQDLDIIPADAFISINVSVKQFTETKLLDYIDYVLATTGLPGQNLKIEITESVLIRNQDLALYMIEQFSQRQIKVSLDDFGTGYSALSYLRQLPIDMIKIDRSFIHEINTSSQAFGIVKAIITLANSLHIPVISEGIENLGQQEKLRDLQCQFGQGYLFMKPFAASDIEKFIQSFQHSEKQSS